MFDLTLLDFFTHLCKDIKRGLEYLLGQRHHHWMVVATNWQFLKWHCHNVWPRPLLYRINFHWWKFRDRRVNHENNETSTSWKLPAIWVVWVSLWVAPNIMIPFPLQLPLTFVLFQSETEIKRSNITWVVFLLAIIYKDFNKINLLKLYQYGTWVAFGLTSVKHSN